MVIRSLSRNDREQYTPGVQRRNNRVVDCKDEMEKGRLAIGSNIYFSWEECYKKFPVHISRSEKRVACNKNVNGRNRILLYFEVSKIFSSCTVLRRFDVLCRGVVSR